MNKNQRYYALHREECNAIRLARYHNHPDTVAKREEKERKRKEKEEAQRVEKEAKQAERERIRQLKTQLAIATHGGTSHKARSLCEPALRPHTPSLGIL